MSMFIVGDKVWSISYGWGEVISIDECKKAWYPVRVKFEIGITLPYTLEGKYNTCGVRDLFFEEILIPKSALERPRKTAEQMLDECKEVEFKHNGRNYYIYKRTANGNVLKEYDSTSLVYGVKYISFEDACKIIRECKENNRG